MVSSINLGDRTINYSGYEEKVQYWSILYDYPNPCLQLTSPPATSNNATLKIIFRSDPFYELCNFSDCQTVEDECNSFCFLESLKKTFNKYNVMKNIYLRRTSESYDIQLFPPMRNVNAYNVVVEYYKKKSLQRFGEDAYKCVEKCLSFSNVLNCSVLNSFTLDVPVSSLCPISTNLLHFIEKEFHC